MMFRGIAIALTTLSFLVIAELGARGLRAVIEPASKSGPAPEVPGPAFVAENLAFRNIEHFTMRPGLTHGAEYRMDRYGLRIGPGGLLRMDRHDSYPCRKVWMFGGSTTMGLGLAAADTLPAQLNDRLGPGWCVFNLGMGSQESTQELLLFYEMLQRDHRPDLVVFYDGVNESMGGPAGPSPIWDMDSAPIASLRGADPWYHVRVVTGYRSGLLWLARQIRGAPIRHVPTREDADRMIARYRVNVALLEGMADAVDAQSLFVWQPALAYEMPRPNGAHRWRVVTQAEWDMWYAVGTATDALRHEAFERADPRGVHDMTDVFWNVREQVWSDPRHTNSYGTRLIAARLAALVRAALP